MPMRQVYSHYEPGGKAPGLFRYCPYCRATLELAQEETGPRPRCPSCGFKQHRNPAPTVSVLILDRGRVLLGKRGGEPGRGTWSLPSGYVEWEDDFLTTAIREAREETGLDVEIVSIINVVSSFVSPRFHFLGIYVSACVVGGELSAGDDLSAVDWFPLGGPLPEMGFQEDEHIIGMVARADDRGLGIEAERATAAGSLCASKTSG